MHNLSLPELKYDGKNAFKQNNQDLVRIYNLVVQNNVVSVLEFGCGYSTYIIGMALARNKSRMKLEHNDARGNSPFQCYSVETSELWINEVKNKLPKELDGHNHFFHSKCVISSHMNQICNFYEKLPSIIPDFIYLDGPDNLQIKGDLWGFKFDDDWRKAAISADILRIEPLLSPHAIILVDGRIKNVLFLKNNLKRKWSVFTDKVNEYSIFYQ